MTAVEWYFEKIKSHFEHDGDLLETALFTYAIAKQKEKEQIEDAYGHGQNNGYMYANSKAITIRKDQYYNATFKGNK
jgi:hypothetical protein